MSIHTKLVIIVVIFTSFLTNCTQGKDTSKGSMIMANPSRTGVFNSKAIKKFSEQIWRFTPDGGVNSAPVVSGGLVYFLSDHDLYAVDIKTGKEKWKYNTGLHGYLPPTIADGKVLFGVGRDSFFYALDSKTGEAIWKFETGGHISSSALAIDGIVYFGSLDRHLYAIDIKTGQERWKFKTNTAIGFNSHPAFKNGVVYFGTKTNLYALDAKTGKEKYRIDRAYICAKSGPAILDEIAYASCDKYMFAFNILTEDILWNYTAKEQKRHYWFSSPALYDGILYFGSSDNGFYAVDAKTGKEVWESEITDEIKSGPSITDDVIYLGGQKHLYAVDIKTGKVIWKVKSNGKVLTPYISNGVIYFGALGGDLYAVR